MQEAMARAGIAVTCHRTIPATDAAAQLNVNGVRREADRSVQNPTAATTSGPSPRTKVTATSGPGWSSIWAATAIIGVTPHRNHVTMFGHALLRATARAYWPLPARRTAMAIPAHQAGSGWTSTTSVATRPTQTAPISGIRSSATPPMSVPSGARRCACRGAPPGRARPGADRLIDLPNESHEWGERRGATVGAVWWVAVAERSVVEPGR